MFNLADHNDQSKVVRNDLIFTITLNRETCKIFNIDDCLTKINGFFGIIIKDKYDSYSKLCDWHTIDSNDDKKYKILECNDIGISCKFHRQLTNKLVRHINLLQLPVQKSQFGQCLILTVTFKCFHFNFWLLLLVVLHFLYVGDVSDMVGDVGDV